MSSDHEQPPGAVEEFIARWRPSEGGERRTYQMFLTELCDLLALPKPETRGDSYGFERHVRFGEWDGTERTGRIDLYKSGAFVLEAKQGSYKPAEASPEAAALKTRIQRGHGVRGTPQWDEAMFRARAQAKRYAQALPANEPAPPFLLVADIGYSFELFADFSNTGRHYSQFPDAASFRFGIEALGDPAIRDRLRRVWMDPLSLDPSRRSSVVHRLPAGTPRQTRPPRRLTRPRECLGEVPEPEGFGLTASLSTMLQSDNHGT